jgi:hypothetical protein
VHEGESAEWVPSSEESFQRPVPAVAKVTDGKLIRMFLPRACLVRGVEPGERQARLLGHFWLPLLPWMHCTRQVFVPFMDVCLINNRKLDIQNSNYFSLGPANGQRAGRPSQRNGFTPTITAKSALLS